MLMSVTMEMKNCCGLIQVQLRFNLDHAKNYFIKTNNLFSKIEDVCVKNNYRYSKAQA